MHKRELKALEYLAGNSPCEMPSGAGLTTRQNFITRGWIVRTERTRDFGPELYAMTPKGWNALEAVRQEGG